MKYFVRYLGKAVLTLCHRNAVTYHTYNFPRGSWVEVREGCFPLYKSKHDSKDSDWETKTEEGESQYKDE